MSLTESKMMSLGARAPEFRLPDTVSGDAKTLDAIRGEHATVVMFICNHCPYVKHVQPELVRLANDYRDRGIGFVAISANDAEVYPADGPDKMREVARSTGYPFPYLYDASQSVARAYGAECTPDFFVFDQDLRCAYRGRLDDATPGNGVAPSGRDLRAALERIVAGEPVASEQKPSVGCNIKWKHG